MLKVIKSEPWKYIIGDILIYSFQEFGEKVNQGLNKI
jgi:hypothetical protein